MARVDSCMLLADERESAVDWKRDLTQEWMHVDEACVQEIVSLVQSWKRGSNILHFMPHFSMDKLTLI